MIHNHSLLQTSQELFAPEIVQRMAIATGESVKRIREVLMSIVPAFTSKILERGATFDGASHFLEVVEKNSENTEVEQLSNEIVTDSTSKKMLKYVGPALFTTIKQEVSTERMSAYGLMRYFQEERDYAAGLNRETSEYYELTGEDPLKDTAPSRTESMRLYGLSFSLLVLAVSVIVLWLNKVLI